MAQTAPPLRQGSSCPLDGKIFVFSGRLASLSRREAAALVRIRGGLTRRHVSRHTSYLVIGDAGPHPPRRSRMLMEVDRLGSAGTSIQVLTEADFLQMLGLESACRLRNRYYTSRDVRRLYGFEGPKLRALERMTVVSPILRTNAERYYTFSDLLLFREIHGATRRGGSLSRVARRILQTRAGQTRLRLDGDGGGVLALDSERDGLWSAEDWYNLGCEHDEDPAEIHEAIEAYHRVLQLDPYHVGALINLGNLSYDLGNIDEARRLYERALASDPDNAIAHFNLGNVFDDLGEYRRAIRYFRAAIRLRPENADAHFNLGLVFDRLGQVDKVRRHMTQYLRIDPEGDMADVAREYLQLTEHDPGPLQV